jgi:ABC-type branched-subunit amino acid transport system ATPase component
MSTSALRVENLRVEYAGVKAVRGVSVDVAAGECTAIIGANGAGKTSFLRGISGITAARCDGIWLNDLRIDNLPAEKRARNGLGHVLEGRHIFPGLTVQENLELGHLSRRGHAISTELDRVHALFPDLVTRADMHAGSLSGGQQQFLAIARAMMAQPQVLLLDEPTLGLAPRLVDRVAEVILALVAEGTTVLLVEQSLEVVRSAAKTVHMLSHGRVTVTTTTEAGDLVAQAQEVYMS